MAKSFIYDSVGLIDLTSASLQEGKIYGTVFSTTTGKVDNEVRTIDQSIVNSSLIDGTFNGETAYSGSIRIDLGSSLAVNCVAVYLPADIVPDVKIHTGDSATTGFAQFGSTSSSPSAGWTVFTDTEVTHRYIIINIYDSVTFSDIAVNEIILGNKYDFDITPNTGIVEGRLSGSDINKSYGAVEYSYKRHELIKTWDWQWDVPTTAIKTSLEAIETAVDLNYKKLIYYDGTTYYWVRIQPNSFKFTWQAYNFWTTPMSLVQQLQ
jgi:hypothetical protein